MVKKVFTDESLKTFVDEIKSYTDNAVSKKADISHTHSISNITNLQTTLDGKAASSHTHKVSNISDLTATAKELNYMDGVTSNVQTQLDTLDSALDTKAKRISLNGQCQITSYRTSVIALCKAPTNASCGEAINSYSAGQLTLHRNNGLYSPVIATLSMGASHGAVNRVRFRGLCSSGFSIFNPCTFTYNGVTYGGLEFKTSDAEAHSVTFVGETTFDIFALDIYDSNQKVVLNEEVYNSISYDNAIIETGWKDTSNTFITSANIGSQSVSSATKDGNGNVISSTYETKTDASNKLSAAKAYADSAATAVKNDLLNGAGTAYDTLKELGDLIDNNTSAIDALEAVAAGKANKAHTHAISDVTNLQTALDAKQATISGGASTITSSNLTANRALISNGSGKVAVSAVTSTELGYLDGVTSNLQIQLDAKASSSHTHSISNVSGLQSALDGKSSTSHTHNYAGSSSVGGGANTLAITDTRNVDDTPTEMTNLIGGKGARLDFKSTSTVGLSNGNYAAVLSISPWGDTTNWSGGKNTQLGFCDDGKIQVRKGNDSGWTDWNTIIDSSTIGNQSVKYATSAGSATSATKATQDASGNTITSTYATKTELDTAKSTLQTSINGKANSSHTHTIANITNLQTTLDGKSNTSHTHKYAGSSSAGGAATSANKLNTDAGSATQPVYFANGIPVATTYTLGKSVPSDAKFTDTTYSAATTSANGLMSSTDKKRVDSMSGTYSLGSFASKTVADLQTALDTWLNSYVNIANASAKFQASQDWVTAWNSGDTTKTISAGGTWTVTNIAPYSTKAYAQLRISYYSDEWVVYVHRSSGTWGTAHQAAFKDDLTSKQNTITGGASTITSSNLTASRALVSDSSGKVAVSAVTSTELGYLDGVTSNVQTQLDGKAASSHNHSASNITSGTLSSDRLPTVPISKGGTGATTAAAALTNLGITATATELNYVDGVTSNIQTQLNGKAASSHTHNTTYIPDTRDDNQTPAWYIANYPRQVVTEFKLTSTIGLSGATYCELTTYVQWSNNSGEYPAQETIINGRIYTRYGTADSTWSDWKTNVDSDNISSQSVASATQLKTARTIGLSDGVTGTATSFNGTANITIPVTAVKESYLTWGGKNLSGSVSPIGASLSAEHSANRIAYLNPAAIQVEYSNDAGSTWTDSGLANSAKINLVTTSNGVSVGSNSTVTTNHRTRITLTGQDGANGYVYTRPRKMLINVSTAGHGLTVTIEAKTGASGASWTTLGTYPLSGWSGWNDIPMGISTFGGGANQTGNYWYIRLTFATTSVSSSYATTKSTVLGLRLFGDTCWTRTSNMGETGHLYSYDYSQNATFPANVTATTLSGTTFSGSGVATLAEVKSYLGI